MSSRHGSTEPPESSPLEDTGHAQGEVPEHHSRSRSGHPGSAARASDFGADEPRPEDSTGAVPGERGIPSLNRVRSVQSRVASVLGVTLMSVLGVGLLTWYYSGAIHRTSRAEERAQAAARRRAQADSALPSLGPITPPKTSTDHDSTLAHLIGPPPPDPNQLLAAPAVPAYAPSGPPKKTPGELAFERRLAGPVLAASSEEQKSAPQTSTAESSTSEEGASPAPEVSTNADDEGGDGGPGEETLASLLKPTPTPAVRARVLPTQRFLLPKGAFIDCTLETAISSALPGMTTCVTATDTFSSDGNIVLLERGTKLVGETRGQVQEGKPRLFVLWTEARTPTGVVVPLASPGTDSLGRSGLTGAIDHHWWARFGSAILITLIDGATQGLAQSRGSSSNTIVVSPSTTSQVATEVLHDTLRIRPTIEIAQGDRIQILVARDVDFRSVYALRVDGAR